MIIKLSPTNNTNGTLSLIKLGDVLTFNGIEYDFSVIPDGGSLPQDGHDCKWITGDVKRINGELELTVIRPHGANPTQEEAFPDDIVDPVDGEIL